MTAAVSATPRTRPMKGSSDRFHDSWYSRAADLTSSPTEAVRSSSRRG